MGTQILVALGVFCAACGFLAGWLCGSWNVVRREDQAYLDGLEVGKSEMGSPMVLPKSEELA